MYKTRCHTLDCLVVIKVLEEELAFDENFVSKSKMEAQSTARLPHPNIIGVYDVADEDVYHYIVMELTEGITLRNYIENRGYLENKEAIGVALQVGQGVAAAYEQHIIYHDVKPQSMIISKDDRVKMANLGITRVVSSQTINATAVDSVHYISSEQTRGGYCDGRSDIYSFDITMYEMVTGRVFFEGDNTAIVALTHLEEPVTPPSQYVLSMSRAVEQIVLKCIQKRLDHRYTCMMNMIEDPRAALMDPDADIYARRGGEEDEFGKARPITRDELNSIQEDRRSYPERALEEPGEEQPGHQDGNRTREPCKKESCIHTGKENEGDDVSTQLERIITAFGVVAAVIIVAVVLFIFSRLIGIFKQGSNEPTTETVSMTIEDSITVADINMEDQINMPSVLGLPQDMTREKLKGGSLVVKITGSEYSDNYTEGQIMDRDILAETVVKKWDTVGMTISEGSDRVDLNVLDLIQMMDEDIRLLLEQKGLVVKVRGENSDTAIKGNVIRFSSQVVKIDESVSLYVSKGSQNVEGRVPDLQGQTPTSVDALLARAGLLIGDATVEASDTAEEGLIISQSGLPGTISPPDTMVDYVVSEEPAQTQVAGEHYYIGSIDEACSLSNCIGLASQTSNVRMLIYLNQTSDEGASVYTTFISPRLVVGTQAVSVVLPKIKGAYGVDNNMIEAVDADNLAAIKSYPAALFPVG